MLRRFGRYAVPVFMAKRLLHDEINMAVASNQSNIFQSLHLEDTDSNDFQNVDNAVYFTYTVLSLRNWITLARNFREIRNLQASIG